MASTQPLLVGAGEPKKVAIIGAGWCGLQTMQCLREQGGFAVDIFEKFDNVGGTWSPDLSYHALTIHSARWLNQLTCNGKFFPWPQGDQTNLDAKAPASEVHEMLNRFSAQNGLMKDIHLSTTVTEVQYDSKTKKAMLMVSEGSGQACKGPYDLVVFSSVASSPTLPQVPNQGFEGLITHSSHVKEAVVTDIVRNKRKVAMIGGGKSSTDMIIALQRAGLDASSIAWIQRTPYWFFAYETVFHGRSCLEKLRGALFLVCLLLMVVCGKLGMFLAWLCGHVHMPTSKGFPSHFRADRFNFGTLDRQQSDLVEKVPPTIGEPVAFRKEGVALQSGEVVGCDVVICATGYATGFGKISFVKDGQPIDLADKPLFHHAVVPRFPCLLIAPCFFTHFGPIRGVTLAQYISYYAKASEKLTEEGMEAVAKKNWCRQRSTTMFAFDSSLATAPEWVKLLLDLVKNGVLSIFEFVRIAFSVFCWGYYAPMVLKVGIP